MNACLIINLCTTRCNNFFRYYPFKFVTSVCGNVSGLMQATCFHLTMARKHKGFIKAKYDFEEKVRAHGVEMVSVNAVAIKYHAHKKIETY